MARATTANRKPVTRRPRSVPTSAPAVFPAPVVSMGPARATEEPFEGIKHALDALPANVFVADRNMNLVYVNKQAIAALSASADEIQRLFGVSPHEMLGASILNPEVLLNACDQVLKLVKDVKLGFFVEAIDGLKNTFVILQQLNSNVLRELVALG